MSVSMSTIEFQEGKPPNFLKKIILNLSLIKHKPVKQQQLNKHTSLELKREMANIPYTIDRISDNNFSALISELRTIKRNGGDAPREEQIMAAIFSKRSMS